MKIMKKRVFGLVSIALVSGMLLWSCNDDDDNSGNSAVTDEVADEIASGSGDYTSGISSEVVEVAELAEAYANDLKAASLDTVMMDTTFTKSNSNSSYSYSYDYDAELGYVFEGASLKSIYYLGDVSGSYDAPRRGATDSRSSEWILTGLEVSASAYVVNGTTERTSSSQSKVRNKNAMTSGSDIIVSNVKIDKSTLEILEGTLTWDIEGTVNGESYSYNAVLTYQGNGMGELTIDGMKYDINITSGEVE